MFRPGSIDMRRSKQLRGFTLMEIMLVLVLMVIIAAFAVPRLTGSISRRQLQTSAQQLKADWVRARSAAIRNGVPQLFLYRTDGRSYVVVSDAVDMESLSLLDRAKQELLQRDPEVELPPHTAMGRDASAMPYHIRRLPIDTLFFSDPFAATSGVASMDQTGGMNFATGGGTGETMGSNNLATISFNPDGTTSSVSIALRNKRQETISLTLRGLTGTVTIGAPLKGEPIP